MCKLQNYATYEVEKAVMDFERNRFKEASNNQSFLQICQQWDKNQSWN